MSTDLNSFHKPWLMSQLCVNPKNGDIYGWNFFAFFKYLDDRGVQYTMGFDIENSTESKISFEFSFRKDCIKDTNVIIDAVKKYLKYDEIKPKGR